MDRVIRCMENLHTESMHGRFKDLVIKEQQRIELRQTSNLSQTTKYFIFRWGRRLYAAHHPGRSGCPAAWLSYEACGVDL